MRSSSDVVLDLSEYEDQNEAKAYAEAMNYVESRPPSLLFHNGWPLLNHRGTVRILWDTIVSLATVYIAVVVPYEITFMRANLANRPTLVMDLIMEIFFILDILVNFRTSFAVEGVLVTDARAISMHYVTAWFIIDIIAATPLDILHLFNIHVADMVHLMKTVRLVRLGRLFMKLKDFVGNSALVLSILMFSFLLIAHWAACVWYEIGVFDLRTPHWHVGWLAQMAERLENPYFENRTGGLTEADAYLGAIYFTVSSLTTVGFGNISPNTKPEKAFATGLMLVGALMHAIIFGNVSSIIFRLYSRLSYENARMKELNGFIEQHKFPEDLRRSLRIFAKKTWASNRIKHDKLIQDFPEDIYIRIHLHQFHQILRRPLFEHPGNRVRRELAVHVRVSSYRHGDVFITKDQVVQALHMVSSGALESSSGIKIEPGLLFGTRLMQMRPLSAETLLVLDDCTVHSLSLGELQRVMDMFPQWGSLFSRDLHLHLHYDICTSFRTSQDQFFNCLSDSSDSSDSSTRLTRLTRLTRRHV